MISVPLQFFFLFFFLLLEHRVTQNTRVSGRGLYFLPLSPFHTICLGVLESTGMSLQGVKTPGTPLSLAAEREKDKVILGVQREERSWGSVCHKHKRDNLQESQPVRLLSASPCVRGPWQDCLAGSLFLEPGGRQ